MAEGIFAKNARVRPSQLIAVAERRFGDAEALCRTGENARANGAQYLCGIVIEILLKAQLMRLYPAAVGKRQHQLNDNAERSIWGLVWRSHDLAEMLDHLRDLEAAIKKRGDRAGRPYLRWLKGICEAWTIHARYSTMTSTIDQAQEMLDQVRELKEVMK